MVVSPLIFILPPRSKDFFPTACHWTKISICLSRNFVNNRGLKNRGLKSKTIMNSQSRKLHYHRAIAIVGAALLSSGPIAAVAQQAQSQEMTTTTTDQETTNSHLESWIRSLRRSLFIQINSWLKRWLL